MPGRDRAMPMHWLRKHRAAVFVACLLAAAAVMGWVIWSRHYCACLDAKATVGAIQALSQADWREMDRAAVAKAWPGVPTLPCEQTSASGLEALVAGIGRCCRTCGMCGGPYFVEDGSPSGKGLRAVGVTLCRWSAAKTLGELRTLVEAAVPPNPEATYERGGWSAAPGTELIVHSFRWRSRGDTFILEATAYGDVGRWIGQFDLTRCHPISAEEEWRLEDGSVLPVLRSEVKDDQAAGRRELWLSYLSRCLPRDSACRDAEAQEVWPRVRAVAERQGVSVVFMSAEDCKLGSTTVFPKRKTDGTWELPWSGCATPGAKQVSGA